MIGPAPGVRRVLYQWDLEGTVTFAKIAADLMSAAVLGHQDVDWDLFPVMPGTVAMCVNAPAAHRIDVFSILTNRISAPT